MTLADRIETKLAKRGLADQILHEAQLKNLCPGQYERFVKIAAEVRKLEAREHIAQALPKTGSRRLDDWAQTTCSSAVARLERALQRVEGGDAG
jgi:hypothetical protein